MVPDAGTLLDIAFVAALVVGVPLAALYAQRNVRRARAEDQAQLRRRGWVRTLLRRDGGGAVTRLWAFLPEPTPLYLRVSDLDPVAALAGQFGLHDLKVGEPRFDARFVVRSNQPELARRLLDAPTRAAFMRHRGIDFSTGAIANLLGADHFPERDDRELRALWRLLVAGEPDDAQCVPLLALARGLAARIAPLAREGGWTAQDFRVGRWEGS